MSSCRIGSKVLLVLSVAVFPFCIGCGPRGDGHGPAVEDAQNQEAEAVDPEPVMTPAERLRARAAEQKAARMADAPDVVRIVEERSRLCPEPDCGQGEEMARLPRGVDFEVEDVAIVRLPRWSVLWFRVTHEGRTGWVSEFNTSASPGEPRYH